MAEVKLTKNELRAQQERLKQLTKYLPTLQLKKAMLQAEVALSRQEIIEFQEDLKRQQTSVEAFASLLSEPLSFNLIETAKILEVNKRWENIAGVEVPYYEGAQFAPLDYNLFDTPPWVDAAILGLRNVAEAKARVMVGEEKKSALEKELREVSIRVNLFEKILIPRSIRVIKKIKVFLGDQQLAAVSQAKTAKNKIIERKEKAHAH